MNKRKKLIGKALETPDGREVLKQTIIDCFPKCTHDAYVELIDNVGRGIPMDVESFWKTINDDTLDFYNADQRKNKNIAFDILKMSSHAMKK